MVDRIQINKTTFMNVDGQWRLVDSGVFDVTEHSIYTKGSGAPGVLLAEASGTLKVGTTPTSVRNYRERK